MSEVRIMLLLITGVSLWMAGGKWWKGYRRYLWPLAAVVLLWHSLPWWRLVLAGLTTSLSNHLPYGEQSPWSIRLATFATLPLGAGWLHPGTLLVSLPLSVGVLSSLYVLSRKLSWVTWKTWEAEGGFVQATALVWGVMG